MFISLIYFPGIEKSAKFVRENESDEKTALLQQIKACNSIITILSQELDEQELRTLEIAEEGQVLTHNYVYTSFCIKLLKGVFF